jgi:hypothetical protein
MFVEHQQALWAQGWLPGFVREEAALGSGEPTCNDISSGQLRGPEAPRVYAAGRGAARYASFSNGPYSAVWLLTRAQLEAFVADPSRVYAAGYSEFDTRARMSWGFMYARARDGSLVPRVLAWIDRRDLDRRKALELVRYHVRRSTPAAPSLLGRAELRELTPYADGLAELDATWRAQRGDTAAGGWSPARLIERSRQVHRHRVTILASVLGVSLAVATLGLYRSHVASARAAEDASLRTRDLGRFRLELAPFDWDPVALQAVPVDAATLPRLAWGLHATVPYYPDALGAALLQPSGEVIEVKAHRSAPMKLRPRGESSTARIAASGSSSP